MGDIVQGQLDWGPKGGKCYECWRCDPCCGGYCCLTWWCCGQCNQCQMFAWSVDQDCAVVNHCLPVVCCGPCVSCVMRHTIRNKAGVSAGGPMDGFVGDILFAWCCGACAMCQELRAAHTIGGQNSWDFIGAMQKGGGPKVQLDPILFPPVMGQVSSSTMQQPLAEK